MYRCSESHGSAGGGATRDFSGVCNGRHRACLSFFCSQEWYFHSLEQVSCCQISKERMLPEICSQYHSTNYKTSTGNMTGTYLLWRVPFITVWWPTLVQI